MSFHLTISLLPPNISVTNSSYSKSKASASSAQSLNSFWSLPSPYIPPGPSSLLVPPSPTDFRLSQLSVDYIKHPTLQSAANQIVSKGKKVSKNRGESKDGRVFKIGSLVVEEGAVIGVSKEGKSGGNKSVGRVDIEEEEEEDDDEEEEDDSLLYTSQHSPISRHPKPKPKLGSFDLPFGMIQLFRSTSSPTPPLHSSSPVTPSKSVKFTPLPTPSTDIVAVLAIPSYMTASDFLIFVGGSVDGIEELRMLRDSTPNRCIAVIKMTSPAEAQEFIKTYEGKPFTGSNKSEICHPVPLLSLQVAHFSPPPLPSDSISTPSKSLSTRTRPHSPSPSPSPTRALSSIPPLSSTPHEISISSSSNLKIPLTLRNLEGIFELPTCPVCLERMDGSVTGLRGGWCEGHAGGLGIGVGGSRNLRSESASGIAVGNTLGLTGGAGGNNFETCGCESKWSGGNCPSCSLLSSTSRSTNSPPSNPTTCQLCSETSSLWSCLLCGFLGCGRYASKHAQSHFLEDGHRFAMEVRPTSGRVWDYVKDGYVHRLLGMGSVGLGVGGLSGGEPVTPRGRRRENGRESEGREKIEAIGLEYSYLLTSQLENQKVYYDERMAKVLERVKDLEKEVETEKDKRKEIENEKKEVENEKKRIESEVLEGLKKDLNKSNAKISKLQQTNSTLQRDLDLEKSFSRSLKENLEKEKSEKLYLQAEVKELKVLCQELKEQVRDVMVALEVRGKVEEEERARRNGGGGSGEDGDEDGIAGGSAFLGSGGSEDLITTTTTTSQGKSGGGKKKKKKK